MPETPEIEFDLLQLRAHAAGYHVQRHKIYDPARGNGDLYLQPRKHHHRDHMPTIIAYATPEQIHARLCILEQENRRPGPLTA